MAGGKKKTFYRIVNTDLNMPCQSGYDFLHFLKASPLYKDIPVIIFSTSVSEKELETSLASGALDYIPKPVLIEDYKGVAFKMNAKITEYK